MAAALVEQITGEPDATAERAQELERCILHIDLDGFYAQVESKRLGLPRSQALGVVQWGNLIAINYAAKRAGISRHTRVAEAQALCPGIALAHVETVSEHGASSDPADSRTAKVSLERYRLASQEVFTALAAETGGQLVERASIDEAFVDVSAEAAAAVAGLTVGADGAASATGGSPREAAADPMPPSWVVVGVNDTGATRGGGAVVASARWRPGLVRSDSLLWAGMAIAARLRAAVERATGFTCSAGVAHNKLLAKLCSAMHKPNQQTALPAGAVEAVLAATPLRKLRGLGGKLGRAVEQLAAAGPEDEGGSAAAGARGDGDRSLTAAAAQRLALAELRGALDEGTALWVWRRCRGLDGAEAVVRKGPSKSLLSAKSFSAAGTVEEARKWMRLLCTEFGPRLARDWREQQRRPALLVTHWRQARGQRGSGMRSSSAALPGRLLAALRAAARAAEGAPRDAAEAEVTSALRTAAEAGLQRCVRQGGLPCSWLALSATDFKPLPARSGNIAAQLAAAGRSAPPAAAGTSAGAPEGPRHRPQRHEPAAPLATEKGPAATATRAATAGAEAAARAPARPASARHGSVDTLLARARRQQGDARQQGGARHDATANLGVRAPAEPAGAGGCPAPPASRAGQASPRPSRGRSAAARAPARAGRTAAAADVNLCSDSESEDGAACDDHGGTHTSSAAGAAPGGIARFATAVKPGEALPAPKRPRLAPPPPGAPLLTLRNFFDPART